MATTEVYYFPHATVAATWPFDTPEEEERWLEGFKKATTKFLLAAERDIAEHERREREASQREEDKQEEVSSSGTE